MTNKNLRAVVFLIYFTFCLSLLSGCVSAQTGKTDQTTGTDNIGIRPTPTAKSEVEKSVTKGRRLKLSRQPLEIRLFFAPDYNLAQDEKTGAYPDKSPKWAEFIETEVRDIDLNHDGKPERMITFLTDPFGREINPETFDVYFFRLEKGSWKVMNRKPFNFPDQIKFINSAEPKNYDEISFPDTREITNQSGTAEINIISVNRFSDGEYRETECRNAENDETVKNCPPRKNANDY